jgi:hypothetical protein
MLFVNKALVLWRAPKAMETDAMPTTRFLLSSIAALCPLAVLAVPFTAGAADINVYTNGPRPVIVDPAPRVYVRPAGVVTVGPRCVTRSVRVWVAGRYVYRNVRVCG